MGGTLSASGDVRRHEIKHLLRAHVSQPSQATVIINFIDAGLHKVTVVVDNIAESELRTCEVSVQVGRCTKRKSCKRTDPPYTGLF